MRILLALALAACVASCAIDSPRSIYPVASRKSPQELLDAAKSRDIPVLDLEKSHQLLTGLHDLIEDASTGRQKKNLVASELLYYGTLVAVLGVTLDSRAARNTGAAVGAAAELFSGHYKLADQKVVFDKALARIDCARMAIMPLSPGVWATFPSPGLENVTPKPNEEQTKAGVTDAATSFAELPQDTLEFVDQVQTDLIAALNKITLSAPTRTELTTSVNAWNQARAVDKPTPPGAEKDAKAVEDAVAKEGDARKTLESIRLQRTDLDTQYRASAASAGKLATPGKLMTPLEFEQQRKTLDARSAEALGGLVAARAQREDAERRLAASKAQQTAFITALYAYKSGLTLCLQQHQQ